MIGQTFSHYRILEKLGGGGMGVVYKAIDLRLNRFVALKFLPPDVTRDDVARQRFRQEAQAASALDHPNIGTIHEIDETPDHQLFLALAYYDGETLKKRIERGSLPVETALDTAIQIAHGLTRAHQSGIVHRDVKPANIMITVEGLVKIVDFGLAKLAARPTDDTRDGITKPGSTVGTVAYMAPEQIRGRVIGPSADVWALGVVIYEMLSGGRPFSGGDDFALAAEIVDAAPVPIQQLREGVPPLLQHAVARALEKDPAARYQNAGELLADLDACRKAIAADQVKRRSAFAMLRRPVVAISAAAILVAATFPIASAVRRYARERWARDQGIPEIMKLVEADDYQAAFVLAEEVSRSLPDDAVLEGLWPQFSSAGAVVSKPEGADVFVQPFTPENSPWKHLGKTPLRDVVLPRGVLRMRVEKDGFEPRLLLTRNPGNLLGNAGGPAPRVPAPPMEIELVARSDQAPALLPVPGGDYPVGLTGFNSDQRFQIDAFGIDRLEVTNKEFKSFVDRGAYRDETHWKALAFVKDARPIGWQEGVGAFLDSTGRPGPATWELGSYQAGQEEMPVTGVSWYEAVAYCQAVGKSLPTMYHWGRAALAPSEIGSPLAPAIIPLSNFSGKALAAAGTYKGLGPYGTYDMAGNAREWVLNEAVEGRRWILGGAWNDPDHIFNVPNSLPPLDRSATNGFRCARYASPATIAPQLTARVVTFSRDNRTAKAVSDEIYSVFKRQYAHAKSPLNVRVETPDTSQPDWIREVVSFDSGYETGRTIVRLYIPTHFAPPYQAVIFFPGVGPFVGPSRSDNIQLMNNDFFPRSGRVFVAPVFKGSYERWDPFLGLQGEAYLQTFRTRMGQWREDLGRVIDMLEERKDIDTSRLAYFGSSFGASSGFPLIALEDRLKVAILSPAGFTYREMPPEADALHYVSRVTLPVLMMGGRHDYIFPLEANQQPMFDRLGTPAKDKKHVVFDAGHANFPRSEMIREMLGWLDHYFGPPKSSAPAGN